MNLSLGWIFITVMTYDNEDKNSQCDENFSPWWKFKPAMQIYQCDEILSLRYNLILRLMFITWMEIFLVMETCPCYENFTLRWKFIYVMINSNCDENLFDETFYCDENLFDETFLL